MSKSEEYKNKIQLLDINNLQKLWEQIKKRKTPGWPAGKAFEYLIIRAFEIGGAEVSYPFEIFKDGKQIEQIDGVIYFQGISCIIECKDFEKDKTDFTPLAKMRSQLLRRPSSTIGSMFALNGFTESAIILASHIAPQTILLWEGTEIEYVLNANNICNSFIIKYKWYIERCIPDFNTKTL